jgi:hypothetical protein
MLAPQPNNVASLEDGVEVSMYKWEGIHTLEVFLWRNWRLAAIVITLSFLAVAGIMAVRRHTGRLSSGEVVQHSRRYMEQCRLFRRGTARRLRV